MQFLERKRADGRSQRFYAYSVIRFDPVHTSYSFNGISMRARNIAFEFFTALRKGNFPFSAKITSPEFYLKNIFLLKKRERPKPQPQIKYTQLFRQIDTSNKLGLRQKPYFITKIALLLNELLLRFTRQDLDRVIGALIIWFREEPRPWKPTQLVRNTPSIFSSETAGCQRLPNGIPKWQPVGQLALNFLVISK